MAAIPGVSDYIPDTAGDLNAGLNIARAIQANKQAAFEREQQKAQLAEQKRQHNQMAIEGLLQRGVEPVLGPDGGVDPVATAQKGDADNLAQQQGAVDAIAGAEIHPDMVQNHHYLTGYTAVKQQLNRQQMMNEARQKAQEEMTNRAIQQQTLRNSGALDMQSLRNQGITSRQMLANEGKLDSMKGTLEWGGPSTEELTTPAGKKITILHKSPRQVQVIPEESDATKTLQNKMGFEEFKQGLQSIQFLPKDQQEAALATLHQKFAPKPAAAAAATAGAPVQVKTKEERDALPKGTVYISPSGKISTKE